MVLKHLTGTTTAVAERVYSMGEGNRSLLEEELRALPPPFEGTLPLCSGHDLYAGIEAMMGTEPRLIRAVPAASFLDGLVQQ